MEFPDLGKQCNHHACGQLDFLPVKCDACQKTFCNEHYKYESHGCSAGYQKDVQVPVCPLCNSPVPGKSTELPDIRVSRHIDSDCQSDRAVKQRNKVYANKCSVKGCKQKELIPVVCDNCTQNYCLRHRHPQDHSCAQINSKPIGKAGAAALSRVKVPNKNTRSHSNDVPRNSGQPNRTAPARGAYSQTSIQGNLSEDAGLRMALQASLSDTSSVNQSQDALTQEQSDFLLAQAIAQSEQEARRNSNRAATTGTRSHRNCQIS